MSSFKYTHDLEGEAHVIQTDKQHLLLVGGEVEKEFRHGELIFVDDNNDPVDELFGEDILPEFFTLYTDDDTLCVELYNHADTQPEIIKLLEETEAHCIFSGLISNSLPDSIKSKCFLVDNF